MAYLRHHTNRGNQKPDIEVGDQVVVNNNSLSYGGKRGTATRIYQNEDGRWLIELNGGNINLYAYKFDLVSRASVSNNESAYEKYMIQEDPFAPKEMEKQKSYLDRLLEDLPF